MTNFEDDHKGRDEEPRYEAKLARADELLAEIVSVEAIRNEVAEITDILEYEGILPLASKELRDKGYDRLSIAISGIEREGVLVGKCTGVLFGGGDVACSYIRNEYNNNYSEWLKEGEDTSEQSYREELSMLRENPELAEEMMRRIQENEQFNDIVGISAMAEPVRLEDDSVEAQELIHLLELAAQDAAPLR